MPAQFHTTARAITDFASCSQMVFPQVVQVIGVASHRDQYFLVTELCKFKSVADCLQEHKAEMTIQRRLRFLKHAAQGLAFLHDRHVIHLDVKPQNLLVPCGLSPACTPSCR